MKPLKTEALLRLAAKYIWWKTPEEAVRQPLRIVAQVMNIGDYDDVQDMANEVDEEYLRTVLREAEAGQFNERSWAYWHYRLHLSSPGILPALPQRRIV
jgi:hypothetical protein